MTLIQFDFWSSPPHMIHGEHATISDFINWNKYTRKLSYLETIVVSSNIIRAIGDHQSSRQEKRMVANIMHINLAKS